MDTRRQRELLIYTDMKFLIVFALAVFTGCHANPMWQDQVKLSMEMMKDAFWDYVAKATHTTEDMMQKIRESEMGTEINAKISGSADTISQYALAVRGQVNPLTHELLAQMSREAERLKVRLEQDLSSVKAQLEPYIEELKSEVPQQVEQLKKDLAFYKDALHSETVRANLIQRSEELRMSLEKGVADLQAQMGPKAEEVKHKLEQHLQDLQKNMAPFVQNLQSQLVLSSQEMQHKLDPFAQDLKAKLTALWEAFKTSIY